MLFLIIVIVWIGEVDALFLVESVHSLHPFLLAIPLFGEGSAFPGILKLVYNYLGFREEVPFFDGNFLNRMFHEHVAEFVLKVDSGGVGGEVLSVEFGGGNKGVSGGKNWQFLSKHEIK